VRRSKLSISAQRIAIIVAWMAYAAALSAIVVQWFAQGFDNYPLTIMGLMVFLIYLAFGFFGVALTDAHWPQSERTGA
jgi:uncharacterized membrane protein